MYAKVLKYNPHGINQHTKGTKPKPEETKKLDPLGSALLLWHRPNN